MAKAGVLRVFPARHRVRVHGKSRRVCRRVRVRWQNLPESEFPLRHCEPLRQKAMTLSGGERRRLEITRALVTNPAFILLDEPFSGVDPKAVYEVQQIIEKLKHRNTGILITDHNVRETLSCVDRAYLMSSGTICCEGDSSFLVNDPKAREVYLGPRFTM